MRNPSPDPPNTPDWADDTQRCENCRHWNSYDLAAGYCELPSTGYTSPVQLVDGGAIRTHPNHWCIAWDAPSIEVES